MTRRFHIAAMLAFTCSCTQTPVTTRDTDAKRIRDDQEQWLKDFESKDLNRIISHYSDDAIIVDKGGPAVTGRDAARNIYRESAADASSSLSFAPSRIEVSKSGDLAYVVGSYRSVETVPETQKTAKDSGTYVSIYKKQADGSWKVVADIGASEVPLLPKQ
jgi:uncharacterized protein (TIGR02246 family)